ncbi:MAG TPA: hypothetical protein VGP44_05220 [Gemmatimonadales bacterium]|nr:hypothetical protein [Gemmatimonadales bacterium]
MLAYRDFVPQQIHRGFLTDLIDPDYESFDAAVAGANAWISEAKVTVFQLETVVLPNPHAAQEEGTADGALRTSPGAVTPWHQFLRVWYRTP